MKLNNQSVVLPIIIVSIIFVLFTDCASFDPYQTLGLKRGASVQDIRKAYKQKAKEWYSVIYFLSLIFTFFYSFFGLLHYIHSGIQIKTKMNWQKQNLWKSTKLMK